VVRVNGAAVLDEMVGDVTAWQEKSVDLSRWQGKLTLLSLVLDSRTGKCGKYAIGLWGEARIAGKDSARAQEGAN